MLFLGESASALGGHICRFITFRNLSALPPFFSILLQGEGQGKEKSIIAVTKKIILFHLPLQIQSFTDEYNQKTPEVLLTPTPPFILRLLRPTKEKVSTGCAILMEPEVYGDL